MVSQPHVCPDYMNFDMGSWMAILWGKMITLLTVLCLHILSSICNFSSFPIWFLGRIVSDSTYSWPLLTFNFSCGATGVGKGNNYGHMIKMATTPIYVKNFKILYTETKKAYDLKLTSTYYTACIPCAFIRGTVLKTFSGRKLQLMTIC